MSDHKKGWLSNAIDTVTRVDRAISDSGVPDIALGLAMGGLGVVTGSVPRMVMGGGLVVAGGVEAATYSGLIKPPSLKGILHSLTGRGAPGVSHGPS